jgi:hypothetical protein
MNAGRQHRDRKSGAQATPEGEREPRRSKGAPGPLYRALALRTPHEDKAPVEQRNGNGVAPGADAAVDRASSSSGAPLPHGLRRQFEGALGADLGAVRVHTGESSAAAAEQVGARAYTIGNDIHFGSGQFNPQSAEGRHLLAHETAHTVQQRGVSAGAHFKREVSRPGDHGEVEADRAADRMVAGRPLGAPLAPVTASLGRQPLQRDETTTGPTKLRNHVLEFGVQFHNPLVDQVREKMGTSEKLTKTQCNDIVDHFMIERFGPDGKAILKKAKEDAVDLARAARVAGSNMTFDSEGVLVKGNPLADNLEYLANELEYQRWANDSRSWWPLSKEGPRPEFPFPKK